VRARAGLRLALGSVGLGLALGVVALVGAAPPPASAPRPDPGTAAATPAAVTRVRDAVVGLQSLVPPDRPSAATLGEERGGSATIIDPDGLAVTVGYLVLDAARIDVTLGDGRRVAARIVGHDFESGLALIRLDPAGAPYAAAQLGQSAGLAVGHSAAIVGMGATGPAAGVLVRVTGVGPFVAYWEYLLDRALYVAPHHPAFGGAALVDSGGALVGVVSLRLPAGHLAIPIDLLAPARDALVRTGRPARPPRPWLGIRAVSVDGGIGVAGVSPAGPAESAGLRAGDVIMRVNGERVADVESFYRRLWAQPLNQPLELSVWRNGMLETVIAHPRERAAPVTPLSP
jgi:S1-C subfamily serine protease